MLRVSVAEAVLGRRPARRRLPVRPRPFGFPREVWNLNVSKGFSLLAICLKRHDVGLT